MDQKQIVGNMAGGVVGRLLTGLFGGTKNHDHETRTEPLYPKQTSPEPMNEFLKTEKPPLYLWRFRGWM